MAINEYGQGGGGGTALTVKESGGAAIEDVSTIKFDDGSSGFAVTDEGSGVVEITLGSHWKDLEVDGQTTLTPDGEEDLEIEAGSNITITTDASSTPKKLTITATDTGATTLATLTDTAVAGLASGQVLVYDGSNSWDNKAVSGDATIAASGALSIGADKIKDTHVDWGTGSGQVSTDDVPVGSTNLYYTDGLAQANRLDEMAAPTGAVALNSQKITGLGTGVASTDAITKAQLDGHTPNAHNHSGAEVTSGTVALARGGTGAGTQQAALDAITGSGTNTEVLTLTGGNAGWAAAPGGTTTFTGLTDTPGSLSGQGGKSVVVNSGGTALELTTGGGGNWTASPEDASLDGVVALEKQASSPSATADFGKVYVKDFTTTPTAAEVLFHLDDNVTDSSSNGNNGTATSITYATSEAGASETGFGKSAVFDGTSNTTGGDSYITFDDIDIGDSDFTCEFWIKHGSSGTSRAMISIITGDSMGTGYFAITKGSNNTITVFYWNGSSYNGLTYNPGSTVGTWYHYAVVRDGTTHSFYAGVAGDATGTRIGSTTETVYDVGGEGDDWVIGRLRTGAIGGYNFTGEIDEVLISKEARYDGIEYVLPAVPYSIATVTTSELYFMNSAGTETKLS